jgi:hypothetical protein
MKLTLLAAGGAVVALMTGVDISTSASASTISILRDGSTLAGATTLNASGLTTGDTTGVTYGKLSPAKVGRTPARLRWKSSTPKPSSIERMRRLSVDCLSRSASAAPRKQPWSAAAMA